MTTFTTMFHRRRRAVAGLAAACGLAAALMPTDAAAAERQTVVRQGDSIVMIPARQALPSANDYENAKGVPLPLAAVEPSSPAAEAINPVDPQALFGTPGSADGAVGDGTMAPVRVAPARSPSKNNADEIAQPEEFGTYNRPFTTNRVDPVDAVITNTYPFRAAGRFFFRTVESRLCARPR